MKKYPYHATLMSPFNIIFLSEKCNIKHSTQYFINTVAQKGHTCKLKLLLQIKYSTCKLKLYRKLKIQNISMQITK